MKTNTAAAARTTGTKAQTNADGIRDEFDAHGRLTIRKDVFRRGRAPSSGCSAGGWGRSPKIRTASNRWPRNVRSDPRAQAGYRAN